MTWNAMSKLFARVNNLHLLNMLIIFKSFVTPFLSAVSKILPRVSQKAFHHSSVRLQLK